MLILSFFAHKNVHVRVEAGIHPTGLCKKSCKKQETEKLDGITVSVFTAFAWRVKKSAVKTIFSYGFLQ